MRIMLMTDMEGVAGVKDLENWCETTSRYYPLACELLTEEINAAVDGFYAGGAEYVLVADGHGAGGILVERLDFRVEYQRGWYPSWPFGLDNTFDGVAWVGQHAKASSEYAHIAHTQSFSYIDLFINGVSIGEFGQFAMCGAELGVPAFFGSGDLAFTKEAEALAPGIVTCAVKRGVMPGTGGELTKDEYSKRNAGAVHTPPLRARQMIRESAEKAIRKLKTAPPPLIPLKAPFERVAMFRPDNPGEPRTCSRERHESSVIALLAMPFNAEPCS